MTNGYCAITINGVAVGLKFGMLAVQLFSEAIEKGKRLFIDENLNELGITYVLWTGYINNCEVKLADPVLSFENFADLVEDASYSEESKSQVFEAIKCWSESRTVKTITDNVRDTKKKKKKS